MPKEARQEGGIPEHAIASAYLLAMETDGGMARKENGQSGRGKESALAPLAQDEELKQKAIQRCQDQHRALIDCIDSGKFCWDEQKAFWSCYKQKRGGFRTKLHVWFGMPGSSAETESNEE